MLTADAGGVCDADRLAAIQAPLRAGTVSRTSAAAEAVKAEVQKQQKELSRSISPKVQAIMMPGYEKGFAEAGIGSHRRRVAIIEGHVEAQSKTIFSEAISPIVKALEPLRCAQPALQEGSSHSECCSERACLCDLNRTGPRCAGLCLRSVSILSAPRPARATRSCGNRSPRSSKIFGNKCCRGLSWRSSRHRLRSPSCCARKGRRIRPRRLPLELPPGPPVTAATEWRAAGRATSMM